MDIARLIKFGDGQAVLLPEEFRFEGSEIHVKKFEAIVLLIPRESQWKTMEASSGYFRKDFLQERNQPQIQGREDCQE